MTLSWQRAASEPRPAGSSQRRPPGILSAFPGGGVCPGAELVISHLSPQQLEDVRSVRRLMKREEALDQTSPDAGRRMGLATVLCVLYFLFCKSAVLGGLGVASVGQVEPQQVWQETRLGPFSPSWGPRVSTVRVGSAVSSRGG